VTIPVIAMKHITLVVYLGAATLWAQDPERERTIKAPARPGYDEEMNPAKRGDVLRDVSTKPPASEPAPWFAPTVSHRARELGDRNQVSFATLAAPKEATEYLEKATKEIEKARQRQARVIELLERAIAAYEPFAEAWYLLGETRLLLGDPDQAREAFERAIMADSSYTDAYLALASMALKSRRLEEAMHFADRALEHNPFLGEAHLTRAAALYNLGKPELAKQILRDLLDKGERAICPRVHEILGEVLASEHDFRAAAVEYHEYLKVQPSSATARRVRAELKQWKAAGLIE
jgi:tetratricopeptide (TPR) repeat protein